MGNALEIAEKDYISRWRANAKQHFDDGDYNWVCDLIKNPPYHRILEIGCGAGYSTLNFLQKNFDVISIDSNHEAVECTKRLLKDYGYSAEVTMADDEKPMNADALLWEVDLIHEMVKIKQFMSKQKEPTVDLIVLCNPGGQLTTDITQQEKKYLLWGGFSEEEVECYYRTGNIGLLHKWALIYAACGLALQTETPILLVERDFCKTIQDTLEQIGTETACRKIFEELRQIKNAPADGVTLGSTDSSDDDLFWGAALYFPR